MKIEKIERQVEVNYYVETDKKDFPTYRRSSSGSWERLMGESWESVYMEEKELECLFREYRINNE